MILCEIEFRNKNGAVEQFDTSSEVVEDIETFKKRAGQEFRNFCKEMGLGINCILKCRFQECSEV